MKKLITTLIFLVVFSATYSQIGYPKNRLLREIDETKITERLSGDTTIISFYNVSGSIFFIKFENKPQEWYFVDGVAVKVIISQTRLGHFLDKRHVRRKWVEMDGYYVKGNRAVIMIDRKYVMWKY
jgi:hypothetical protein